MNNNICEKLPTLLFLLEYNKFHDILKAMINKKISTMLLDEYGCSQSEISPSCEYVINKSVTRFTIPQVQILIIRKQLIEIKGVNVHSTKHYYNAVLRETLKRKLQLEEVCSQTRKLLWLQFTQYFGKSHLYNDLELLEVAHYFAVTIQKDIKRTFKAENIKQKTRQVLSRFCQYNPYVGYCQGMNSIVAFIISKGFNASEAFFIFKQITQDLLPCDYYTNMDNVMAYSRIFYELLNFTHPDIYQHLKKISIQLQNTYAMMVSFVLQWFVCLFCNDNINQQITQVIWDFFLLEGITILFKAALGMFDLLRPHILKCSDFQSYNIMQKQVIKTINDKHHIRKRLRQTFISPKLLFLIKQKLLQPKKQNSQKQNPRKVVAKVQKSCQINSNVCFKALEDNFEDNSFYDCFVFKPKNQIKIIPEYLQTLDKQYFKNEKPKDKKDTLMIGRIDHVCRSSSNTVTQGSLSDKNKSSSEKSPLKSLNTSPTTHQTPTKENEQRIREKVCQRIAKVAKAKTGLVQSESVIFMQQMARNVSISNLLQHYDMDELFQ